MKASNTTPWIKYFDREKLDSEIPKCTMYEELCNCSKNKGHLTALYYYGTKVSYRHMIEKIDWYAAGFSDLGVREGDIVSFLTVSIPEAIYSIYGLNKIGAVCNFIDVRTDESHIIEYIKKAKSKVLIVLDYAFDKIRPHIYSLGLELIIVESARDSLLPSRKIMTRKRKITVKRDDNRILSNEEFEGLSVGKKVKPVEYKRDMPAVITRTGGTTGRSKGVVLTNENMNALYANFRDFDISGEDTKLLNFLPLAASYGIACGIHMALCMLTENILVPKFKAEDFAGLVYRHRPNHIIGVPLLYDYMMHSKKLQKIDLSFVQTMAAGGDSASISFEKDLYKFIKDRNVDYPLAQGYGLSETTSACAFGIRDIHKNGSVGVPCAHNIISVFKPGTSKELNIGEHGEICICGPTVMKEYLDEPEETANVIWTHEDGKRWVHSGDFGYMDEDGFLFIEGRLKRSIIRFDGHKNYPVQIEGVVDEHKCVRNSCVIPVRDLNHEQGELPLVVIEKEPKCRLTDEDLTKEIMQLCKRGLEERSWPVGVKIVNSIPTTDNGKNDYNKLIKIFEKHI